MRTVVPLSLVLVGACVVEAETLDEGCADELLGAELLGGASAGLLERADCYRGYLGLQRIEVRRSVQQAAEAHVAYLLQHEVLADDSADPRSTRRELLGEDPELEGFTGAFPFDRNVATGAVAFEHPGSPGKVWGWFLHQASADPDATLGSPFVRDMLLQPSLVGVGYAEGALEGVDRGYLDVVAQIPSARRVGRPIVYPKHGQEDVPTGWIDPWADHHHDLRRDAPWGYPITVTFSPGEAERTPHNPYAIAVKAASLRPKGGDEVEVVVLTPSAIGRRSPRTSVAVVPAEELLPDTTYELRLEVDTLVQPYEVSTSFTTGGQVVLGQPPPAE